MYRKPPHCASFTSDIELAQNRTGGTMPTLRGLDEREAAELCLEFMKGLAKKLEAHHARWWGLSKPYRFQGVHFQWGRPLEDIRGPMDPPSLMNLFLVKVRKRWNPKWEVFVSFSFWRADWDETPSMRSATGTLYYEDMVPAAFYDEVSRFVKDTFGCEKIRYFSSEDVETAIRVRLAQQNPRSW